MAKQALLVSLIKWLSSDRMLAIRLVACLSGFMSFEVKVDVIYYSCSFLELCQQPLSSVIFQPYRPVKSKSK
ncbi:hypothetical protein F5Y09DRAFT_295145 [Xylaria sp. FL1042]|nr:hypothetical protein F5Y09DRAFT_295145 [Xylaria sp. FL1042]